MPTLQIPKKLRPLLNPKKFKIIYGGRGGAKSMTVADILLMRIVTEGIKVGAMREMQNSIDDSVHSLFCEEIERLKLPGFTIQNTSISHARGGQITYKGLARNTESVKSMHGFDVFWVEEAATLSKKSIDLLVPTLRVDGSELWMTFNPASSADPVSIEFLDPFKSQLIRDGYYEDDLHIIIKINYNDNPFFPDNLEQLRVKQKQTKPPAEYRHIWEGEPNDSVENSLIPVEWFEACIDAHKVKGFEPKGAIIATHDPSDEGGDTKGFSVRQGSVVLDVQEREFGDVNSGLDWAMELAVKANCDHFGWDFDGIGMGLKRQVEEYFKGRKVQIFTFQGGREVDNPNQTYDGVDSDVRATAQTNKQLIKNKRAQYYWRLRNKCYNTYRAVVKGEYVDPNEMISFSSDIQDMNAFKSQLCRIPRKKNPNGMLQIVSKVDMVKAPYNLPSPGGADSVMIGQVEPDVESKPITLNFDGYC